MKLSLAFVVVALCGVLAAASAAQGVRTRVRACVRLRAGLRAACGVGARWSSRRAAKAAASSRAWGASATCGVPLRAAKRALTQRCVRARA